MTGWKDDSYCIACGRKNPIGMKLEFILKGETLETSRYAFPKEFQGYKGVVHGGMISLFLDEAMVNLPLRLLKTPVVSGSIRVKLKKPLKVGEEVIARAWMAKKKKKIFIVEGRLIKEESGEIIAESEAVCFRMSGEKII